MAEENATSKTEQQHEVVGKARFHVAALVFDDAVKQVFTLLKAQKL